MNRFLCNEWLSFASVYPPTLLWRTNKRMSVSVNRLLKNMYERTYRALCRYILRFRFAPRGWFKGPVFIYSSSAEVHWSLMVTISKVPTLPSFVRRTILIKAPHTCFRSFAATKKVDIHICSTIKFALHVSICSPTRLYFLKIILHSFIKKNHKRTFLQHLSKVSYLLIEKTKRVYYN